MLGLILISQVQAAYITQPDQLWTVLNNSIVPVNTDWKLGVGTSNPGSRLTIRGVGASNTPLTLLQVFNDIPYATGNGVGAARAEIGHSRMQGYIEAGSFNETNPAEGYLSLGILKPSNLVTEMIRMNHSGVGIGVTNPSTVLDIKHNLKITEGGTIYNNNNARWLDLSGVQADSLLVANNLHSTAGVLKTDGTGLNVMAGSLQVKGDLIIGGLGKKVVSNKAASFNLPAQGSKAAFLSIGTNSLCKVSMYSSENQYYQPIELYIIRQLGKPIILRNSPETHIHSNDIIFSSDTDGYIWAEKVKYSTNKAIGVTSVNQLNGTCSVLNGTETEEGSGIDQSIMSTNLFRSNGTSIYYNLGDVGIGTTNPGAKLDVAGSFRANSATISLLGGGGNKIVMTDNLGNLYSTSSSIATGLPTPTTSGSTLRSNGSAWIADTTLYNNGANIGIGTTSLSTYKLNVAGNFSASNGNVVGDIGGNITFESFTDKSNVLYKLDPSSSANSLNVAGSITALGTSAHNYFAGRVGIRNSSPGAQLEVEIGNSGTETFLLSNSFNNYGLRTGNGGYAGLFGYQQGNDTGSSDSYGTVLSMNAFYDGTSWSTRNGWIRPSFINLGLAGNIIFSTASSSQSGVAGVYTPIEVMRITRMGDVGIGTTNPLQQLHLTGSLRLPMTNNSVTGVIYKDGTSFIHNFQHPEGGTAKPTGGNTFIGLNAGNFTMGSTATQTYHGSYNTGVGDYTLNNNTTGYANTANGYGALRYNTSGYGNTASGYVSANQNTLALNNASYGAYSLQTNTTGNANTAIGTYSLQYTTGVGNTALGYQAARYLADGVATRTTGNYGLYLGANTRSLADGTSNEIVIGYNAIGNGSSTATYGNTSMLKHIFPTPIGNVYIGTTTVASASEAKLVVNGGTNNTINVLQGYIGGLDLTPTELDQAVPLGYLKSNYAPHWKLKDGNLYASSTDWNVGIGTTNPGVNKKLHVVGNTYIDGGLEVKGEVTADSMNINPGKLTVGTIDPLYQIKGINYSTFASALVGGVTEEIVGRIKLAERVGNEYQAVIDFSKEAEGSDLWVWYQVVDFNRNNVEVIMTPYGKLANTYYYIDGQKLILRADQSVEVSYRFTAKRFDWRNWPTKAQDQQERPSFIIN